jgi:hypothetical protein
VSALPRTVTAVKCSAETMLTSHEFARVQAVDDGIHQPARGRWYCEYPAATMHFRHVVVVQERESTGPDDDPAPPGTTSRSRRSSSRTSPEKLR